MKTFNQWLEANAKLFGAQDHELYGQPQQQAPQPQAPQQAPKSVGQEVDPRVITDRYIRAFSQALDNGADVGAAEKSIEPTAAKLAQILSKSWPKMAQDYADWFRKKSTQKLANFRSYQRVMG